MEIFILIIHSKACSDWHWQICKPFGIDVKKIECIYEYRYPDNKDHRINQLHSDLIFPFLFDI